jgi:hypothetical protein
MASQITHIVLADKLYPAYFDTFDRDLFLLGNVFPDIRTPAHLDRQATHLPVQSVAEIQAAASAFMAGVLLHNLIDTVREDFVERQGAYDLFHATSFPPTIFKQFEDVELYDKLADWSGIIAALEGVPEQTAAFGVDEPVVRLWHRTLQAYFENPFDEEKRIEFLKIAKPESAAKGEEVNNIIAELRANPRAKTIVANLYDAIEDLLPNA